MRFLFVMTTTESPRAAFSSFDSVLKTSNFSTIAGFQVSYPNAPSPGNTQQSFTGKGSYQGLQPWPCLSFALTLLHYPGSFRAALRKKCLKINLALSNYTQLSPYGHPAVTDSSITTESSQVPGTNKQVTSQAFRSWRQRKEMRAGKKKQRGGI